MSKKGIIAIIVIALIVIIIAASADSAKKNSLDYQIQQDRVALANLNKATNDAKKELQQLQNDIDAYNRAVAKLGY